MMRTSVVHSSSNELDGESSSLVPEDDGGLEQGRRMTTAAAGASTAYDNGKDKPLPHTTCVVLTLWTLWVILMISCAIYEKRHTPCSTGRIIVAVPMNVTDQELLDMFHDFQETKSQEDQDLPLCPQELEYTHDIFLASIGMLFLLALSTRCEKEYKRNNLIFHGVVIIAGFTVMWIMALLRMRHIAASSSSSDT